MGICLPSHQSEPLDMGVVRKILTTREKVVVSYMYSPRLKEGYSNFFNPVKN